MPQSFATAALESHVNKKHKREALPKLNGSMERSSDL
jgi:hypothetical protein